MYVHGHIVEAGVHSAPDITNSLHRVAHAVADTIHPSATIETSFVKATVDAVFKKFLAFTHLPGLEWGLTGLTALAAGTLLYKSTIHTCNRLERGANADGRSLLIHNPESNHYIVVTYEDGTKMMLNPNNGKASISVDGQKISKIEIK